MLAQTNDDFMLPFQLEISALRGRLVRLNATVGTILAQHDYPDTVSRQLAELLVLAATLAGALKYEGRFSLQMRGDGPVSLMVADCTHDGQLRGYARFDAASINGAHSMRDLLGQGHVALNVMSEGGGEGYQGVVELAGDSLTDAMLGYFRRSEQIQTALTIEVEPDDAHGAWRAGGLMLQRLPDEVARQGSDTVDDWRRSMLLMGTLTSAELLDTGLPPNDLLFRLFHEEGVRVFPSMSLDFGCPCSAERVEAMLKQFPLNELQDMQRDDGKVEVTCQFCSRQYVYDEMQLRDLKGEPSH